MELDNQTEKEYKQVRLHLEAIGIKPPTGVKIMENIVSICEKIAEGIPAKEIINRYDLKCVEKSFAAIFRKATGVSVKDIPSMKAFERRRRELRKIGYGEEAIDEILKVVDKGVGNE